MRIFLQFSELQEVKIFQKFVDEREVLSESRGKFLNGEFLSLNLHELEHLVDGAFLRILKEQTEVVHKQPVKLLNVEYFELIFLVVDLHDYHEKPIEQASVGSVLAGVLIDVEMRVFSSEVKDHLEECLEVMRGFREELEQMLGEDGIFGDEFICVEEAVRKKVGLDLSFSKIGAYSLTSWVWSSMPLFGLCAGLLPIRIIIILQLSVRTKKGETSGDEKSTWKEEAGTEKF